MATISNTPRPGYVWDSTDNVWYPIGTGPHTHADYITSGSAINPTIVDAKGDIIAATAADTVARLAVGSNDQVLTADSSTATGLKWATPATGTTYSGVDVSSTATQTLTNTTATMINFDTETFDVGGYHDNVTNNSRLTVPSGKAGYYQINASINFASNATGLRYVALYKNGVSIGSATRTTAINGAQMWVCCSAVAYGAVGDYFQVEGYQSSGGNLNSGGSYFSISYLGA